MVCIVTAAFSSAAIAQYTNLPDTVIEPGESIEIDLDGDDLADLTFRADATGPGEPRYTVETGPNTYVHGFEVNGGATAAGLPPGVIIGPDEWQNPPQGFLPRLQGILLLRDGSSPCVGEWCDPSVRFLGVRVGPVYGGLYGWVRIRTVLSGDGAELSILDSMIGNDPDSGFTLINGFYTEQICDNATTQLRVWMGGVWGNSCVPGGIAVTDDGVQIEFTTQTFTGSGCDFSLTNWVSTRTMMIEQPGVYALSSTIVNAGTSTTTDRGLHLLGCCPADWNADGVVNFFDVSAFLGSWQESAANATATADLNLDGQINFLDLTEYLALYTVGCP